MLVITWGEMDIGGLAEAVGLSQSAFFRHLAKLREDGLVAFCRASQTSHSRLDNSHAARVLATLTDILCPPEHGDQA